MPLAVGQVVWDRYRIDALLERGSMSAVYRATDLTFDAAVAVKENLGTSLQGQRQFTREARILRQLHHPNLPRVYDHFFIPGQGQYLVMDFIDGEDLGQLASQGPVPEELALRWMKQVLDALAYLHGQTPPIIHRDVKPANVKITPQGRVMLVDFGLAKMYDPLLSTGPGARGLTRGYAPPEQYTQHGTDARSDLYAVGATLYMLLTGQTPPESVDLVMGTAKLIPPRQLNPAISPCVEKAILRAMQAHPTDRFQTATELRTALSMPAFATRPLQTGRTPIAPEDMEVRCMRARSKVRSVAFSPFGVLLASGSDDGTVSLWRVSNGQRLRTLRGHAVEVHKMAFSPDGTMLASGSPHGPIKLWTVSTGRILRTLPGPGADLAFYGDGAVLCSVSDPSIAQLWRIGDGRLLSELKLTHLYEMGQTILSYDGLVLAAVDLCGIYTWIIQLDNGAVLHEWRAVNPHLPMAFSSDRTMLASVLFEGSIQLCRVSDGRILQAYRGHARPISGAFSPDDKRLAVGFEDGTVQMWRVPDGVRLHRWQRHKGAVRSVSFAPDGALLATASSDGTIRLWSVGA